MKTSFHLLLKSISIILFFSLGVFAFRFITSVPLLSITGNWLVNEKSNWFIGILWMVIGQFGQVIASFGVGIFCGMRFLYEKPKFCGIAIVCVSFFFAALIFMFKTFSLGSGEAVLFVLSIFAVLVGNKLGEQRKKLSRRPGKLLKVSKGETL